jgi:hypothetical protein
VKRFSTGLLVVEAFVLIYPTVLGVVLIIGSVAPVASGSFTVEHFADATTGIIVLLCLGAAWWLLFRFLRGGSTAARRPKLVWGLLSFVALASTVAFFATSDASNLALLRHGILYVPTFLHLSAEVWLRAA